MRVKAQKWLLNYILPFSAIFAVYYFMSLISPIFQHTYDVGDFNATSAVAKAMMHGQVYFKNIFEQRGVYLYFWHFPMGLFPFVQAKNLIWLMETLLFGGFYLIMRQIGIKFGQAPQKFKKDRFYSFWSCILVCFLAFSCMLSNSGAPEEWCLVPIAYSIYLLFKFNQTKKLTWQDNLLLGIAFGYVINVKYNVAMAIAGLYFGIGMYLLIKKQFKLFGKTVLIALLGTLIGFMPAIIYFGMHNAIGIWLKAYFISNASSINLSGIVVDIFNYFAELCLLLLPAFFSFYLGIRRLNKIGCWVLTSVWLFAALGVLLIGRIGQAYGLPLMAIAMCLTIAGAGNVASFIKENIIKQKNRSLIFLSVILGISLVPYVGFIAKYPYYSMSVFARIPHRNYYAWANQKLASYRANRLIDKFHGGKILNFAMVTDDIFAYNHEYPKLYYFDQTTMPYQRFHQSFDAQIAYLKNRQPAWVETPFMTITMPDSLTLKQYRHYHALIEHNLRSPLFTQYAGVTASHEYYRRHIDQYANYPLQHVHYQRINWLIGMVIPKVLAKNYSLVYLEFYSDTEASKYNPVFGGHACSGLFVRNDYLKKYPALKKYVIDPKHLAQSMNQYNH